MERERIRTRDVIIIIGIAILCLTIGIGIGAELVIDRGIDIAQRFIEVEVDKPLIKDAVFSYYNNIGNCYPKK